MSKLIFAFLVSPWIVALFVPSAIAAGLLISPVIFLAAPFIVPFIYLYSLVTVLPTFLLLRHFRKLSPYSFIPMVAVCGIASFVHYQLTHAADLSTINGVVMIENKIYTDAGVFRLVQQSAWIGFASSIAAYTFLQIAGDGRDS